MQLLIPLTIIPLTPPALEFSAFALIAAGRITVQYPKFTHF
jgi:hypothetical protein